MRWNHNDQLTKGTATSITLGAQCIRVVPGSGVYTSRMARANTVLQASASAASTSMRDTACTSNADHTDIVLLLLPDSNHDTSTLLGEVVHTSNHSLVCTAVVRHQHCLDNSGGL